jgi:hypothetical protein
MSASDRRRAQAQPSTGDVNRMRQTRSDRRRAQAKPSTEDVNRMRHASPSHLDTQTHCQWTVGI